LWCRIGFWGVLGGDAGHQVHVGVAGEGILDSAAGFDEGAGLGFVVGGRGIFFELAEVGVKAEPGGAELALIALEEGEVVAGGILVEAAGEGLAGGVSNLRVEGEELFFGVGHAVELPDDLGDLGDEVVLHGSGGAEVILHFVEVDFVGGIAFAGEEGGLGAAVFAGVLGDGFFAFGCARAGGFFGVFAVGGEFFGGDAFR